MVLQRISPGSAYPRTYFKGGDNDRILSEKVNYNFEKLHFQAKAQRILNHSIKGGFAPVMADPPTLTQQSIGGPSAILTDRDSDSPLYSARDPNLTLYSGAFLPNSNSVGWVSTNGTLIPSKGYGVRFSTDAEAFEIRLRNINGNGFRVMVNGEWIWWTDQQQWGGSDLYDGLRFCYWRVDFGAGNKAQRTIDVFFNEQNIDFGGINVGPSATNSTTTAFNPYRAWKSPVENEPNCMVWGDSWVVGNAASHSRGTFAHIMGDHLGIKRVTSSGVSSQGYLATVGSPAQKFRDRIEDINRLGPLDLLVIGPTGLNDNWQTPAALQAEVTLFANEVLTRQPDALVAVFGPPRTAAFDFSAPVAAAIKQGWLNSPRWNANRMRFFDILEGRGWFDHQNGNFTQAMYSTDDNHHPNPNGHMYLGKRVADTLKGWLAEML